MHRLFSSNVLFVFFSICSCASEGFIVAPQSLTVEQLVATPLATAGSGVSLSIPETISSYVNDPTYIHSLRLCYEPCIYSSFNTEYRLFIML